MTVVGGGPQLRKTGSKPACALVTSLWTNYTLEGRPGYCWHPDDLGEWQRQGIIPGRHHPWVLRASIRELSIPLISSPSVRLLMSRSWVQALHWVPEVAGDKAQVGNLSREGARRCRISGTNSESQVRSKSWLGYWEDGQSSYTPTWDSGVVPICNAVLSLSLIGPVHHDFSLLLQTVVFTLFSET